MTGNVALLLGGMGLLLVPVLALAADTGGEGREHRVVVDVAMDGQEHWAMVLNNVENLQKAFGGSGTKIEVVVHGAALGMLLGSNETLKPRIQKLASAGVAFAVCENTMRRKNVTKQDLMPFATTVDSGVAEVVRRQEQGWSYLKAGS